MSVQQGVCIPATVTLDLAIPGMPGIHKSNADLLTGHMLSVKLPYIQACIRKVHLVQHCEISIINVFSDDDTNTNTGS